jgi:hypothetical protein
MIILQSGSNYLTDYGDTIQVWADWGRTVGIAAIGLFLLAALAGFVFSRF